MVTPALQTPEGMLVVLIMGLFIAYGAWSIKEEIDLFFFRASGGSTAIGKSATVAVPLLIVIATLWYVVDTIF